MQSRGSSAVFQELGVIDNEKKLKNGKYAILREFRNKKEYPTKYQKQVNLNIF